MCDNCCKYFNCWFVIFVKSMEYEKCTDYKPDGAE
jgi:hypothetical protein